MSAPSDLCKENEGRIARLEEKAVSFKELMAERDRRYSSEWDSQRRETVAAFKAAETAISKQEAAQHDYNEKSNEFRQTLSDQAKTFVTNDVYTVRHEDLIRRIDSLEQTRDEHYGGTAKGGENKRDRQWQIGAIIAAIGILFGVLFGVIGYVSKPAPAQVEVMNNDRNKVPVKQ